KFSDRRVQSINECHVLPAAECLCKRNCYRELTEHTLRHSEQQPNRSWHRQGRHRTGDFRGDWKDGLEVRTARRLHVAGCDRRWIDFRRRLEWALPRLRSKYRKRFVGCEFGFACDRLSDHFCCSRKAVRCGEHGEFVGKLGSKQTHSRT